MRLSILTKFLLTMLAVAFFTLGPVTWLAVRGFLEDKKLDVFDRNNLIGRNVASESHDVLAGTVARLRVFAEVYLDPGIPAEKRAEVARGVFSHYGEFVRLSIFPPNGPPVRIYNREALKKGGFTEKTIDEALDKLPIPSGEAPEGGVWVLNRTPSVDLPLLTVATEELLSTGAKVKLVGDILPDTLFDLFKSETATRIFMLDGDGRILAHSDAAKMLSRAAPPGLSGNGAALTSVSNSTSVFADEAGERQLYTWASVGMGKAVVIAYTPEREAFKAARDLVGKSVAIAVTVFVLAALVSVWLARRMTRPLVSLSDATHLIARGEFGTTVPVTSRDEIGDLAQSFNRMGAELTEREKKLEEARMALVQSEKMAAFGQLGAGIAHEVKNPLAGILGYAQLSLRKTPPEGPLKGYLEIIEKETKRCKSIIENLLKFARQEKTEMSRVEVGALVEDSMKLVEHQLAMNQVKITRRVEPDLPAIVANANQLQQVLMNLSINAQHAMESKGGGMLTVSAGRVGADQVEIRVADSGTGIKKEHLTKIFEPFFTTKPAGKGTGLGLSVTYGIIRDHKGTIAVDSEVGVGTTFRIRLPVATEAALAEATQPPAAAAK